MNNAQPGRKAFSKTEFTGCKTEPMPASIPGTSPDGSVRPEVCAAGVFWLIGPATWYHARSRRFLCTNPTECGNQPQDPLPPRSTAHTGSRYTTMRTIRPIKDGKSPVPHVRSTWKPKPGSGPGSVCTAHLSAFRLRSTPTKGNVPEPPASSLPRWEGSCATAYRIDILTNDFQ